MTTSLQLRILQITVDFLLIILSFTLAYFFRVGFILSTDFPFESYASVFIPTSIAWMGVLIFHKNYSPEPIRKRRLFMNIITANLVGITLFVLIFFYKRDIFFSRLILVYVWGFSNILLIASAWTFRLIKFFIYKKGIGTKKVLVVGANQTAEEAVKNLQKHEPYYQVVAVLDAYGSKKGDVAGVPILGKMNSLEEVVNERSIDVILQADCIEQSLNLVHFCELNHLKYFLVPSLLGAYKAEVSVKQVGRQALITV